MSLNKSYQCLLNERESVLDEIYDWKHDKSSFYGSQRIGLWENSTYLDELLYILQNIEKDIIVFNKKT